MQSVSDILNDIHSKLRRQKREEWSERLKSLQERISDQLMTNLGKMIVTYKGKGTKIKYVLSKQEINAVATIVSGALAVYRETLLKAELECNKVDMQTVKEAHFDEIYRLYDSVEYLKEHQDNEKISAQSLGPILKLLKCVLHQERFMDLLGADVEQSKMHIYQIIHEYCAACVVMAMDDIRRHDNLVSEGLKCLEDDRRIRQVVIKSQLKHNGTLQVFLDSYPKGLYELGEKLGAVTVGTACSKVWDAVSMLSDELVNLSYDPTNKKKSIERVVSVRSAIESENYPQNDKTVSLFRECVDGELVLQRLCKHVSRRSVAAQCMKLSRQHVREAVNSIVSSQKAVLLEELARLEKVVKNDGTRDDLVRI